MRSKNFFYKQGSNKYIPENFDLKSLNCPPEIWERFNKLTESHKTSLDKRFFPAAVNGRYKNYKKTLRQL